MEAVAPDAFGMQLVRNGVVIRQCIMVAMECGIEESKQATCGSAGKLFKSVLIGARLCGWCSGASGTSFSRFVSTSALTSVGSA